MNHQFEPFILNEKETQIKVFKFQIADYNTIVIPMIREKTRAKLEMEHLRLKYCSFGLKIVRCAKQKTAFNALQWRSAVLKVA